MTISLPRNPRRPPSYVRAGRCTRASLLSAPRKTSRVQRAALIAPRAAELSSSLPPRRPRADRDSPTPHSWTRTD